MFRRNTPPSGLTLLKELFWPSIGWMRAFRYYRLRITRLSDSTYRIAAGLAAGASMSFTPFLGVHFIGALGIAWLVRGNYLAALIGTFFGNPWTFPFLFLTSYQVGIFLLHHLGFEGAATFPPEFSMEYLLEHPLKYYLPMALGGICSAIIFWIAAILPLYYTVKAAQFARRLRIKHKYKIHHKDNPQ